MTALRGLGKSRRFVKRRRSVIAVSTVLGSGLAVAIAPAAGVERATATSAQKASNGRIAFVLSSLGGACDGAAGDVATANPDGSDCRLLTFTGTASTPRWNPAADTIAFVRASDGASSISLIDANGGNERGLATGPGNASDPAWSPDGSQIAFTSDQTGVPEIYVADAETGKVVTQLSSGPAANMQPAWSPDGTQVAFVSNRTGTDHVFLMAADGTNQHSLSNDPSVSVEPTWSPDGRSIAFASDRLTPGRLQIYASRVNGTGIARVASDKFDDEQPSWSPDGRLIAFTRNPAGAGTIRLVDAAKHSSTGLPHYPGAQPSWARLPVPATPVPGVIVGATPHGAVQVQPGGSGLSEPLRGPAGVPVAPDTATTFTPAKGASVTLDTKLADSRSAVITLTGGTFALSQPGGGHATRIELIGEPAPMCPKKDAAHVAYIPPDLTWGIKSRGNGHPKVVKGKVTLGFHGTNVRVVDRCRVSRTRDNLGVVLMQGTVDLFVGHKLVKVLHVVHLHPTGHGKFRTKGRYAAATVFG